MSAQDKLARYNIILDVLSQIKIHFAQLDFVPQSIRQTHEILEALVLKELKDLEIAHEQK